MKKFVAKILILILSIVLVALTISVFNYGVVGSQYRYNYNASLIDKLNRLNSINEPKIILVGNSNLSFGIDSGAIEQSFNMPVVNLGLHGGLGNAFHEDIAKQNINEGDIVVVCHTEYLDDDTIPDPALAWITYDYNKEVFPIFRTKDYINMLRAYPTYVKKSMLLWITGSGNEIPDIPYSRTAFNEYGDVIHRSSDSLVDDEYFENFSESAPLINDICVDRLNVLNDYCRERGAYLVVAGYPIAMGEYSDYKEEAYIAFQENLEESLNCPVISNFTEYFFPYDYFYDTNFHLNDRGVQVRTAQLISDIKAWIEDNGIIL